MEIPEPERRCKNERQRRCDRTRITGRCSERNRTDNRLGNLRETTHALVQQNVGLRRDNTSGVTGVSWYKRMGKWRSRIVVDGRYRTRWFDTQEEAVKARLAMKAELHPFAAGPSVR